MYNFYVWIKLILNLICYLALTQGASPSDPPYGTLTNLTLTQGASPPDPPYGTLTYLTLTITLIYKA